MKDKVFTKAISLTGGGGASRYFQMHLPRDAKKITGVETNCLIIDVNTTPADNRTTAPYFKGKKNIGLLSLKMAEKSQQFYSDIIWGPDLNAKDWDFSLNDAIWDYNLWSLAGHRLETPVDIFGESFFIEGYFTDFLNFAENDSTAYTISIHIWYSTA